MPILLLILAVLAAVMLGFLASTAAPYFLLAAVGSLLVFLFAFFSPKMSLLLLLVSMMFSPEIGVGALTAHRSVVVRYDDLLLVIIFFSWLARSAIRKNTAFITDTPVQKPIILYTLICILSTMLGVMRGDIRFEVSVFYLLKFVEYFLLYFMAVNVLESKEEILKYLRYAFFISLAVTFYAYFYYFNAGPGARASAPFEAPVGKPQESEPASLGGYYLLVMGVLLALFVEGTGAAALYPLAALAFIFPAFLLTFSRASYIGFFFMMAALFFKARKRRLMLAAFVVMGTAAIFATKDLSGMVKERVEMTYSGQYATHEVSFLGVTVKLEESAYMRYASLNEALTRWLPQHPVIGRGVTGVGLGDTQYTLLLGEIGLVGFLAFFWMIGSIYVTAGKVYAAYDEVWIKAAAMGLMVSLLGLLLQAIGVNTFIIVRIMEPFWFLTAVIMKLHMLKTGGSKPAAEPA